ncbi:MAG: hypothetical protein DRQ39_08085 [Gammaproteobacteria bacterium]|nr:MAG: hypothetical protein DRQ39_08085 [Gammaproteobacteria bacterium]
MKKILGLMVVASLALTACDENAETSVNEEQVTSGVEEVVVVEEQVNEDKPSISASHSATVSALVEVINHETREVTLRKNDGSTVSFVASEEARNLDQVKVGDVLVVEYIETLDIQVMAVEDAKAEAAMAEMVARTKEGEMPGMAKMEAMVITAIVEEINLSDNTFKLKGPQGNIQQYTARDPENLKKAAVGDLVVITQTKAIALTVQKGE